MKKYAFFLYLILITGFCVAQKSPKDNFDFPKLNKIQAPNIKTRVLDNGMTLYLVEDHTYPTISLRAMFNVGSRFEPADKIGLAQITGEVMRTGGTESRNGDELDALLESLAASVETGIGNSYGYASVTLLKEDIYTGLQVLADILMNPAFNQEKIDLAKIQMKTSISRRNDEIGGISLREFQKLIYGKKSPYARHPEYATVDAITREDIIEFHQHYFHPNNMLLAAWGDFDIDDLMEKIDATFKYWEKAPLQIPAVPQPDYDYKYSVNLVNKEDADQSWVQLGHIGGRKDDPDYPVLVVMNSIMGFDRIFKRVRTDEGLAYSASAYYDAEYDHEGIFRVMAQTKSASTVYAIRIMLEEIEKMTRELVTEKELEKAKDQYLNSYVFNFDRKSKIVNRVLTYAYFDYPLDFNQRIKEGVEKVTREDILRVAKKYLHPQNVQILVVGNPADFDAPLSELGTVNEIDIAIPTPKEKKPQASAADMEKGKSLILSMAEAAGGLNSINQVENIVSDVTLTQTTPMGEMELGVTTTVVFPDKVHFNMQTPGGEMQMILSGEKAWMVSPQGTAAAPPAIKNNLQEGLFHDIIGICQSIDSLSFQHLGSTTFAGEDAEALLISDEDLSFHLYLSRQEMLPLGLKYKTIGQQGPTEVEERYSDYRKVEGIMLPFKVVTLEKGEKASEVVVNNCTINAQLNETLFQQ
jgi:predicted Zn-dependent peptidase